ncbi:AraC family transcriptional regulator [Musicola paradisiaca]|uniref:Transcriptional regulator, AraC family n=1 Tax=Musicola paradisiaca (strain Ech703) TaxID=579405 RepID=C6C828_MUSP7|nr:AraC family transcriptional regulator [Musicola paradisiaca]ACS84173.1 transcriptional regulator, AraC family [Musicola paradisiaca Ech703]
MKTAGNILKKSKINVFRTGQVNRWEIPVATALPEFISLSASLRNQIQKIAALKKSIILYGEPGTELSDVAAYIFMQTQEPQAGYIEFHHATYQPAMLDDVIRKLNRQQNFTLFFQNFDEFSADQQQDIMNRLKMLRFIGRTPLHFARLIFGLRHTLAQSQQSGRLSVMLGRHLDYHQVYISPLRERPQDVVELLHIACREFRQSGSQQIHPDVLQQLQHYDWPGNAQQLRRSIARLLMLSDNREIGLNQAHGILPEIIRLPAVSASASLAVTDPVLCDTLLKCDEQALRQFHPSVSKALLFLGENFQRELTLSALAEKAHISPSHLSYLLKHSLKLSFKQILNQIRIFYACQQLKCRPLSRITNLYLDCGYGDLSHFEKMFKRYTGLTPVEFRKTLKPVIVREDT